jgi:hypothetical protein
MSRFRSIGAEQPVGFEPVGLDVRMIYLISTVILEYLNKTSPSKLETAYMQ